MSMIFPFMGEGGNKHCLTHFTVSFDRWTVYLCIFCLKIFPLSRGYFCQGSFFSIICMLYSYLSSENAQKRCRIRCIKSSSFFFSNLDYLIALLHRCSCHAGLQFPVWSCMAVYVSFIRITCLTYYSWSFISVMWMQSCLTKGFHHFSLVRPPH